MTEKKLGGSDQGPDATETGPDETEVKPRNETEIGHEEREEARNATETGPEKPEDGPRNETVAEPSGNGPDEAKQEHEKVRRKIRRSNGAWQGFGLTVFLNVLVFYIFLSFFAWISMYIGVTQLIYLIPLMIWRRKSPGMLQGIIIGASVTFLLNAACFGIIFSAFGNY
jgi:hypothetical protein